MRHVCFWPKADISSCTAHVRFRGQSGHDLVRKSAFAVAIGDKADMPFCTAYVRLCPKADILRRKLRRPPTAAPRHLTYCMNHPWLTTIDCPVSAFEPKEAKKSAVSATSSTVV